MTIKVPKDMDFHAQAKRDGTHYTDSAKSFKVYPTDGPKGPPDGKVGSGRMNQPQRYVFTNDLAKRNAQPHPGSKAKSK